MTEEQLQVWKEKFQEQGFQMGTVDCEDKEVILWIQHQEYGWGMEHRKAEFPTEMMQELYEHAIEHNNHIKSSITKWEGDYDFYRWSPDDVEERTLGIGQWIVAPSSPKRKFRITEIKGDEIYGFYQ